MDIINLSTGGNGQIDRADIFDLATRYFEQQEKAAFVPGKSYVPASGKVLDSAELVGMLDASLDMWLTAGRFAQSFEEKLAERVGLRFSRLTVSGSAANLLAFTALTSPKLRERRIEPGDEVITVAAGFPTTVNPIVQNGCVPVFVDVDCRPTTSSRAAGRGDRPEDARDHDRPYAGQSVRPRAR